MRAFSPRSSSLFCLRQNLLRSRFGAAKIFSKAKSNAKAAAAAAREWNERERRTRATSSSQEHIPAQVVRRVAAGFQPASAWSVFFSHMFKANCKHPPTATHSARFAEFALSLTQQYLLKFRRKMKTHLRTHTRCFS